MADIISNNQTPQTTQAAGTSNSNILSYPPNGDVSSGGMYIVFTEYEYSRPTIESGFKPNPTGTNVSLPIPMNLSANYSADWGGIEQNAISHTLTQAGDEYLGMKVGIQHIFHHQLYVYYHVHCFLREIV